MAKSAFTTFNMIRSAAVAANSPAIHQAPQIAGGKR
jgi:hypothetical protein